MIYTALQSGSTIRAGGASQVGLIQYRLIMKLASVVDVKDCKKLRKAAMDDAEVKGALVDAYNVACNINNAAQIFRLLQSNISRRSVWGSGCYTASSFTASIYTASLYIAASSTSAFYTSASSTTPFYTAASSTSASSIASISTAASSIAASKAATCYTTAFFTTPSLTTASSTASISRVGTSIYGYIAASSEAFISAEFISTKATCTAFISTKAF
eukprot:gene24136-9721_t